MSSRILSHPLIPRLSLPLIAAFITAAVLQAQEIEPSPHPMMAALQARVRQEPEHADSWRLIAKIHFRAGESEQALEALRKALAADPESVAAHFDFGQLLESIGDREGALRHYATVQRLAPESSYAHDLSKEGIAPLGEGEDFLVSGGEGLLGDSLNPPIAPVGYEIQTFDGSESFRRQMDALESDMQSPLSRWRAMIETGLLYNTNVSLTPISRQLANVDAASFQGFVNPELEFLLVDQAWGRLGPLTRGYFSVNESHQSEFDLASFQGGWFVEREFATFGRSLTGRLEYLYALDLQGGSRFGDRHSLNASATLLNDRGGVDYLYAILSVSDFDDDGVDPAIDSLDGPGFIAGVTRFVPVKWWAWRAYRLGSDISAANTEGADFRYVGAGVNGGATFALWPTWTLEPDLGLGFRIYDDFTGDVDRDEIVLRLALKLRRQINDRLALSLIAGYDRFASDNEAFDAERTEGGLVLTWLH